MQGLTVEYQRFGDPTGVIRLSDRYIRTVGDTAPAEEIGFEIPQENLNEAMAALDYSNFERSPADSEGVRRAAEGVLKEIEPHLKRFLLGDEIPIDAEGCYQIDIVTRVLELAQLPFEILEESHPQLVVTRRIRQPWPPPEVVRKDVPKVLFAWAEPKRRASSRKRMEVPHDRQKDLLDALLKDWGGGKAIVEVENATRARIARRLAESLELSDEEDKRFTHVHLLAHGIGPEPRTQPLEHIDLTRKPPPTTLLALENEDGTIDRCPPSELAAMFTAGPRPETFALATCQSAEVDPVRSGATLAHVLHAAGVPVVLASQLALTKEGSDELIRTFLARVIDGQDPRNALRDCRDALRATHVTTYYDRVALVGYVHVDEGLEERLKERQFKVALARLKATSKDANSRVTKTVEGLEKAKAFTPELRAEADEIRRRFAKVRAGLTDREPDQTLTKAQREELLGLKGSSLKREAEAAWRLSRVLSADDAQEWLAHSWKSLSEAADAYRRAAKVSRDHHWTWVQWLVLEAVQRGSLTDHEEDWIVARAAARDAVELDAPEGATEEEQKEIAEKVIWGWGSLCELNLLAPLLGREDALTEAKACLGALVKGTSELGEDFPIKSTLEQLERYDTWWGADPHWQLPRQVVEQAKKLYDHLKASR